MLEYSKVGEYGGEIRLGLLSPCIASISSGGLVAATTECGTVPHVVIWSVETGRELCLLSGMELPAFSRCGTKLACIGFSDPHWGMLHVYDVATRTCSWSGVRNDNTGCWYASLTGVLWSPDDRMLVECSNRFVRFYDASDGSVIARVECACFSALFSDDGSSLFIGSQGAVVKLDVATLTPWVMCHVGSPCDCIKLSGYNQDAGLLFVFNFDVVAVDCRRKRVVSRMVAQSNASLLGASCTADGRYMICMGYKGGPSGDTHRFTTVHDMAKCVEYVQGKRTREQE